MSSAFASFFGTAGQQGASRSQNFGNFNWNAMTDLSHLDKRIQSHLFRVYATLAMTVGSMAVGAMVQIHHGNVAGFLSQLAAFAAIISLGFLPPSKENTLKRKALLAVFGFCQVRHY